MTAQIKRKTSTKKEAPAAKYYRLRLREWMIFWILVAFTMILIVTIFGDVKIEALNPTDSLSQENETLIAQINTLEARVAELQGPAEQQQLMEVTEPSRSSCTMDTTTAPIDQYASYTIDASYTDAASVSMRIPYSTGWWKFGCDYAAVIGDRGVIQFGPWSNDGHVAKLVITPSESAPSTSTGTRRTVNGMTVYSTVSEERGSTNTWIAYGRNYVYRITSLNWLTDAEAIKIIQSLRVTK